MVEEYRKLLFPGVDLKKPESWEDRAKAALAKEAKRIYLVKPRLEGDSVTEALKSSDPNIRKIAAHGMEKQRKAMGKMRAKSVAYTRRRKGEVEDL